MDQRVARQPGGVDTTTSGEGMGRSAKAIDVYLEVGNKRTFAGAIDWPGWCRSGRDDESALEALAASAPRYALVLRGARLGFRPATDASPFRVVERLRRDATTDFGAPGAAPSTDRDPVSAQDLRRFQALLRAAWLSLDPTSMPSGGGSGAIRTPVGSGTSSGPGRRSSKGWRRSKVRSPRRGPRGGVRWPSGTSSGGSPGTCSTTPGRSRIAWSDVLEGAPTARPPDLLRCRLTSVCVSGFEGRSRRVRCQPRMYRSRSAVAAFAGRARASSSSSMLTEEKVDPSARRSA